MRVWVWPAWSLALVRAYSVRSRRAVGEPCCAALKICFQPASPPSRLAELRQIPYPNSDAYTVLWSAGSIAMAPTERSLVTSNEPGTSDQLLPPSVDL